jgi:predicted nucleic acid-binding protein
MTGKSRVFIDSNIWLYALSDENDEKRSISEELIERSEDSVCLSTQVINEVCANLRRKSSAKESEISYLISSFYLNYEIIQLNEGVLCRRQTFAHDIHSLFGTA